MIGAMPARQPPADRPVLGGSGMPPSSRPRRVAAGPGGRVDPGRAGLGRAAPAGRGGRPGGPVPVTPAVLTLAGALWLASLLRLLDGLRPVALLLGARARKETVAASTAEAANRSFVRLPVESALLRFASWMAVIAAALVFGRGESEMPPLVLLGLGSAALFHAAGAAALRGLLMGEALGRQRAVIMPALEGMRIWSAAYRTWLVLLGLVLWGAAHLFWWLLALTVGGPAGAPGRPQPAALAGRVAGGRVVGTLAARPRPRHRGLLRRDPAQPRDARPGARRAQGGGGLPGRPVAALPAGRVPRLHLAAGRAWWRWPPAGGCSRCRWPRPCSCWARWRWWWR